MLTLSPAILRTPTACLHAARRNGATAPRRCQQPRLPYVWARVANHAIQACTAGGSLPATCTSPPHSAPCGRRAAGRGS
jgi:hypothetical protein